MLFWMSARKLTRVMRAISDGDPGPIVKICAPDMRFRFPGESTWAVDVEGREKFAEWMRRFTDDGIQIAPDQLVFKGFPWRQTICMRGHVHLDTKEGERIYTNRVVIWGEIRWGRVHEYEVYEDTIRNKALEDYLQSVRRHQV